MTNDLEQSAADQKALAERVQRLVERSSRMWVDSLERKSEEKPILKPDPLNTVPAMARLWLDCLDHPQKALGASVKFWAEQAELWNRTVHRMAGDETTPVIEPGRGDRRFKDEMWQQNPVFDYLKQSYLLTARWLKDRLDSAELEPHDRKKLELVTRNLSEAMAPSNYAATNPEVLRTTVEEQGDNILRGLENLIRDLDRGHGQLLVRQTDMDAFKVGENLATTLGAVIFQNDIFQLVQYAPTTETVHETPLLIVAPWINKFYILDLNEKKSMVKWLTDQGHTVFIVSWVNPTEAHAGETWESYMKKGVLTAIDTVLEETGAPKVNVTGYCIGGTMLGTTLAWMAAKGDDRVASATFFTAQLDFTDAGELQAFVDDEVIDTVEQAASQHGYLAAENMFGAFNSLRSTDLIWGFVVNNYLLGKDNFPFDLLYWNSDSTGMPGRVHTFYLDTFYNQNALTTGRLEMDGVTLDLGKITVPAYHVSTIEDHIAPADSVYRGAKFLGSRSQTFILSGSGHIAGVVNPPAAEKYQYWTRTGLKADDLETWRADTTETAGSWWPHWDKWLSAKSKKKVPARAPGATLGVLETAPGSFVKDRSDQR